MDSSPFSLYVDVNGYNGPCSSNANSGEFTVTLNGIGQTILEKQFKRSGVLTETKLPKITSKPGVCSLRLDFVDTTFLSTQATINVQFNNPLFYAQHLNFSFETKNIGDKINQTFKEDILNTVGNSIGSGIITPYTFMGQPTPLILRGKAIVNVLSSIKTVMMCGSETHFNFHSSLLLRKTMWGCSFAKSSTKIFTVQDMSTEQVFSQDFYSLNTQGN